MSWQRRAKETAHASQEIYFTISMLPSTQCLLPSAVFHLSNSWTNCFSDSRTRGWIYFYFPINLTPHGHKSHSTSTGTKDDFVSSEDKTWFHSNQSVLIRNNSKACWHLKNEIQNQPVSNKYDLLARGWCLWRLCSVNASQSTCQLHSDYNTQLFLVPGPEKPHNSVHEQYSSVLLLQQGQHGRLSFMCIHRLSSRTLLQLATSSRQSPETSTSAGNIMPRYLIHQNVCFPSHLPTWFCSRFAFPSLEYHLKPGTCLFQTKWLRYSV